MKSIFITLCGLILSSAILLAGGGPCGSLAVDSIQVTDASCNGASDGEIVVYASGGTGPYTYSNGQGSTGAPLSVLQTFNSNVIANSGSSTGTYYSPASCSPGNYFAYSGSGGCTGGAAYYNGSGSGGYSGCFLRTPMADASGLTTVTMTFDITHSYNSGRPNDKITFSIWINNGYRNTSIVPVTVNGSAANELLFDQARSCETIEVVFDVSSATLVDKSDMLLYINSSCGYSNCNSYFVYIDNVEVLEGGGSSYQSTNTFSGLPAGNYDITIQDGNGCVLTYPGNPITVSEPNPLTVTMGNTPATAYGANDGKAWATVGGGTAPYTYAWSGGTPGVNADTVVGLSPGTVSVTVTDANGCTASGSTTITQPPCNLTITNVMAIDVNCNGSNDGSLIITPSGGIPPLQYSMNNGGSYQADSTFINLGPGLYNIRVRDANGCNIAYGSNPVSITEPPALVVVMDGVSPSTVGGNDGKVWATATGGTPASAGPAGYTYNWSGGVTTGAGDTLVNATAGTYSVTVTDANGCSVNGGSSFTLAPASCSVMVNASTSAISCAGNADGGLTIGVSGGQTPYQYSIDNGSTYQSTATYTNLGAGSYTVIAEDNTGCADTATVVLANPAALTVSGSITPVSVAGGNDGTIDATVGGGSSPYTYSWSNGATTEDLNNLTAGNYCVTVTDNNGCTVSDCFAVNQPGCNLSVSTALSDPNCFGGSDGTITITASQGVGPYQYSINSGSTFQAGNIFTGLPAGNYPVVVTDDNNCTASVLVQLNDPAAPNMSASTTNPSTNGGSDGAIDLTATGGTPPLIFNWSTGETTEDISGLAAGNYCVTVTDDNGCTISNCYTLTDPSNPCGSFSITNVQVTQPLCYGEGGRININISGGQNPVLFSIDSGNTFQNGISLFTGLPAGTYQVLVRDNASCQVVYGSNPVVIQSVPPLNPVISWVPGTGFFIDDDFDSYQWLFNGAPLGAAIDTSLVEAGPGTYAVEVTDANGCTDTSNVITVTGLDTNDLLTEVKLYPNPVQEQLNISSGQQHSLVVTVINLQGKSMMQTSLPLGSGQLDVAELAPGMYLIQLSHDDKTQVRKLIIE